MARIPQHIPSQVHRVGCFFAALLCLSSLFDTKLAFAQPQSGTRDFVPVVPHVSPGKQSDLSGPEVSSHGDGSNTCSKSQQHPEPIFRDLKAVGLYIDVPPELQEALTCRGHEAQCAEHDVDLGAKDAQEYIRAKATQLQRLNTGYPAELLPEVLTAGFSKRIVESLSTILPRDATCHSAAPQVLGRAALNRVEETPGILLVVIKITVIGGAVPPIAIASRSYYRSGFCKSSLTYSLPFSTAVPYGISSGEAHTIINDFERQAIQAPLTAETVTY